MSDDSDFGAADPPYGMGFSCDNCRWSAPRFVSIPAMHRLAGGEGFPYGAVITQHDQGKEFFFQGFGLLHAVADQRCGVSVHARD